MTKSPLIDEGTIDDASKNPCAAAAAAAADIPDSVAAVPESSAAAASAAPTFSSANSSQVPSPKQTEVLRQMPVADAMQNLYVEGPPVAEPAACPTVDHRPPALPREERRPSSCSQSNHEASSADSSPPPQPAPFFFPPPMTSVPWPAYPYPVPQYGPEMPVVPCTSPCCMSRIPEPPPPPQQHPHLAYQAYPIFQPIPTMVDHPFFHRNVGGAPFGPLGPPPGMAGSDLGPRGGVGFSRSGALRECYNCHRPGHLARHCAEVSSDKQCFHCLRFGHVVRNCPQTRQWTRRTERMVGTGSLSSSPTDQEWSSDSGGDHASDPNDFRSVPGDAASPGAESGFNPTDYDVNPTNARFFIIKSNSERDVRSSIARGVWCSTDHGNRKLDQAFANQRPFGPTLLLFSVNNSGKFCGIAEMTSRVDFAKSSGIWTNERFRGEFRLKWTHVKDVPNSALRHIYLANNEFKPVTFSRDTQEVPSREGKRMLYVMHKYKHISSMLDSAPASASTTVSAAATAVEAVANDFEDGLLEATREAVEGFLQLPVGMTFHKFRLPYPPMGPLPPIPYGPDNAALPPPPPPMSTLQPLLPPPTPIAGASSGLSAVDSTVGTLLQEKQQQPFESRQDLQQEQQSLQPPKKKSPRPDSLEEFPSLPKKTLTPPLNA